MMAQIKELSERLHLRSSLYHSKSALGTAEASHWRIPFCPTLVPVPLALEMNGGSRRPKTPQWVNNHDDEHKMVQSSQNSDFRIHCFPKQLKFVCIVLSQHKKNLLTQLKMPVFVLLNNTMKQRAAMYPFPP